MATQDEIRISLDRARKALSLRPALARSDYLNTARVTDGLACECREGDWTLRLDMPTGVGGAHAAPSPGVFSRSALSACIALGVKMAASTQGVPIDAIEVTLRTTSDDRGDLGVDGVKPGYGPFALEIRVESGADPARVEKAARDSLEHSPVLALFRDPNEIGVTVSVSA